MDPQRDLGPSSDGDTTMVRGLEPTPGVPALNKQQLDLLLYLGDDSDRAGPAAGRDTFEALAALGLIELKRPNRIVFTPKGEAVCDWLSDASAVETPAGEAR